MATQVMCDYCGEPISVSGSGSILREGVELRAAGLYLHATVGSYHNTDECPCWDEIVDRIALIHDVSGDLKPKPKPRTVQRPERDPRWIAHDEHEAAWRRKSSQDRSEAVLAALGDEELIGREIAERINEQLGVGDGVPVLRPHDVRRLAQRMVAAGLLREELEIISSHPRYRYARVEAA